MSFFEPLNTKQKIPDFSFERINAYRTKVYCGEDYKEGITAFFEKRTPQYRGKASDLDE